MSNESKLPTCWIRGYMNPSDISDDPVRLATVDCPYRKAQPREWFQSPDYGCSHPSAQAPKTTQHNVPGGVVYQSGGIDGYATFCEPVDMHLTSLGETSRLVPTGPIIETTYRVRDIEDSTGDDLPQLPPPQS